MITFDCKTQTKYNEDVKKEKKEEKKLLHINININAWRNHGGLQNIRVQRGQREQSSCTQSKLIGKLCLLSPIDEWNSPAA